MMGHVSSGMALFSKANKGFSAVGVDVAEAVVALSVAIKKAFSPSSPQVKFESDSLHVVHLVNASQSTSGA